MAQSQIYKECAAVPGNEVQVSSISNIHAVQDISKTNARNQGDEGRTSRPAKRRFRKLVEYGVPKEEANVLCLMTWGVIYSMFPSLQRKALQKQHEVEPITVATKQQYKTGPLRIGIRNSEPMDNKQMKLIHRHLIISITEQFTEGGGPEFLGFTHKNGWILVSCVNKHSFDWLVQELQYLEPWPGAQLSVIPERDLPYPPKVEAIIPVSEAKTVEEALDLLQAQNQGLNTEHWQVLHEQVEASKNITASFFIDEQSLETLHTQNCEAALGFKMVTFSINYLGSESIHPPSRVKTARLKNAKNLWDPIKMGWQTKIPAGLGIQQLLRVMQSDYPRLRTKEWKIINTSEMPQGTKRIVLMDRVSADVINESGYQLDTSIGISYFKLMKR